MLTHCNFPLCLVLIQHTVQTATTQFLVSKKIHFVYVSYFTQYRSVGRAPIGRYSEVCYLVLQYEPVLLQLV